MNGAPMIVRPACMADLPALVALAAKTGGGFTNLPPEPDALEKRLALSIASCAADIAAPAGEFYMLVLEMAGRVTGTASLFSKLGTDWPFYSYRLTKISQTSRELHKSLTSDVLTLVNDFDGYSEVGGLFLDPAHRRAGAGRLLARSRYLFIAQARARFAEKVVADLRGFQADDRSWPFWDGLGRHFFDMEFEAADRHNSLQGNQFIADLMPKYPIYARLLPEATRAAIGKPHRDGVPALKLLMEEGFRDQGYVDIFDGGPSVSAIIDDLAAVRNSIVSAVDIGPAGDSMHLMASGAGTGFRATAAPLAVVAGTAQLSADVLSALNIANGDTVRHVRF